MRTQMAYLTADEFNDMLARRMAQERRVFPVRNLPASAPTSGTPLTRLYNLDHVSPNQENHCDGESLIEPATLCARVRFLASDSSADPSVVCDKVNVTPAITSLTREGGRRDGLEQSTE